MFNTTKLKNKTIIWQSLLTSLFTFCLNSIKLSVEKGILKDIAHIDSKQFFYKELVKHSDK